LQTWQAATVISFCVDMITLSRCKFLIHFLR